MIRIQSIRSQHNQCRKRVRAYEFVKNLNPHFLELFWNVHD
jgi:hypothetical protein